jgi:hypothetical protein
MKTTVAINNFNKNNTPKKLEFFANLFLYTSPIISIAIATSPYGDPLFLAWISNIWGAVTVAFKGISKLIGIKLTDD